MKKAGLIIVVIAGVYGFYEQSKPEPNVWISAFCFMILMLGLLFLSKKTSDNFEKNDEDDDNHR